MDGIVNINKPLGWTSFDVVAKARRILNVKKIGHTGTLDPLATGVLVLCIGKATKLVQQITDTNKEYIAEVKFGFSSTTDDAEGELTEIKIDKIPDLEKIKESLISFIGKVMQLPPNFSAKKINGQRAYKLARSGMEVKLEPKEITINSIAILDFNWPILTLKINCEKGTYIRSIARDLGKNLNTGAYLTGLIRTKVGEYKIENSVGINDLNESFIIPI